MLLALREDPFLRAATVMEEENAVGRNRLVGDHDAVVVIDIPGFKQIQLQRSLDLAPHLVADEEKTIGGRPTVRFPVALEITAFAIQWPPTLPRFDHLLEHRKAFKGDADGALDAIQIHQRERLVAEEGAVQPRLEHGSG